MRGTLRSCLTAAGCIALAACQTAPQKPASLESRLAAQNAIFEAEYQFDLKMHPLHATEVGDYRYNDRLDDLSLTAVGTLHSAEADFLLRLKRIATDGFGEQDLLSHDVMVRLLQQHIDDYGFKQYEMPVGQITGPQRDLADLPLSVPFDSVKHYEDYIARLHQVPLAFAQTKQVLRAGLRDHLMPVRFLLEKVPAQCQGTIAADPFLLPAQKFPDSIPPVEQQRLTQAIKEVVNNEVLPAYRDFGEFIATEYAPHGRSDLSIASLPGGASRYQNDIRSITTVSDMTPAQIHELGLREVARIEAEMLAIARAQGYDDRLSYRQALDRDPRYIPTSAEQIVDDFRRYIAQMRPKLPDLFGVIPDSPLTVEAIPAFQAAAATHYNVGTPDGSRPGRVVVATSDFAHRSMVIDEATAYHEGIPGHHMQLSIAQQLSDLPKFRQHLDNSGYVEGWALYAEALGKEVGFYQEPGSDYGRLSSELFRAVRLVVDSGIHSMGWSRDQVVDYLRQSHAVDEPMVQTETDRYIAWPGQALSYKLGQLKFLELRERARRELGDRFDIRAFHDEMLNGGVLPLDLLEARTNGWIEARKSAASDQAR
ncbi:MAG TPA: DUF885 domain-containing protein [Steroidobacteraceae bacterium]